MIETDVIDSDIALILSRAPIKRANMNLNFNEDTTLPEYIPKQEI